MSAARFSAALCVATLSGACIPEYRPPTLAEPHATVKVRRTYDRAAGAALRELLLVDDHDALAAEVPASLALAPRIDALLVHPIPATFQMHARFFHQEMQSVLETYYVEEMYQETETYDCSSGFGANASYRSCTRQVTRYRQVPRQHWVTRVVDVTDAACGAQNRFTPAQDRVYLLQFNFQEHQACSLSCFEQVPGEGQTFRNLPCPPAPPE